MKIDSLYFFDFRKQLFSKKITTLKGIQAKKVVLFAFFFITQIPVNAQPSQSKLASESLLNKRIEYFSKKTNISIEESKRMIFLYDKLTGDLNDVYNDTTLSVSEKAKRLSAIRKEADLKRKAIVPDLESRQRQFLQSNRRNLKINTNNTRKVQH